NIGRGPRGSSAMKHVRRLVMLVFMSVAMLVASAVVAVAGDSDYPITSSSVPGSVPGPKVITPGAAAAVTPGAAGGGGLARTGSNLNPLWIGLVVLVIGVVLVVATRRRAAVRRRGSLSEAVT